MQFKTTLVFGGSIFILFGLIAVYILYLVGGGYATKSIFQANVDQDNVMLKLTTTQLNLVKMFILLSFIGSLLIFISGIHFKRNMESSEYN